MRRSVVLQVECLVPNCGLQMARKIFSAHMLKVPNEISSFLQNGKKNCLIKPAHFAHGRYTCPTKNAPLVVWSFLQAR